MFPCRYGRRNVVNRCSVVNVFPCSPGRFPLHRAVVVVGVWGGGGGLLVQILGSGRVALLGTLIGHFDLCDRCVCGGWVTSPRPISTGRLGIAAVHLRPINPVVCVWPYPILWVGNLILKCASRLDAFSGYHVRT